MKLHILIKKGLLLVPFLFLQAFATEPTKKLSEDPKWLSLLRYERAVLSPWHYRSAISSDTFFLSKDGYKDPHSELNAMVQGLAKPTSDFKNINMHPACLFPARYKFVKKNLLTDLNFDLSKCTEYQRWNESGQVKSVSLYFATGYFGNPASFFGHPLLKFNTEGSASDFIDTSLNYGAMTPENENPVVYVLKGLFGGYSASFTRHDFFYHNHNYSEAEMRDLWEYKINLKPDEVQEVVDRTWELLAKEHPYYFLVDNCAYRMGQLLEDVFGKRIFFRNKLYMIPIDLFDNLAEGTRLNGEPMVSEINIVPSRYSRLLKMYKSLDTPEKLQVKSILNSNGNIDANSYEQLNEKSKAKVLEAATNYYSFQKLKDKENKQAEALRVAMIRERFKVREKSGFKDLSFKDSIQPDETANSLGLKFTGIYSDELGDLQEFIFRPALYDELNPAIARPENTSLEVFKMRLRYQDHKIYLRSLELFRISNIDSTALDLPDLKSMSWKMRLGLKSQAQTCKNCLVTFVEGGAGTSYTPISNLTFYGLVKGGLQNNRNNQGTLFALPEVGSYFRIHKNLKIHASYEHEKFFNGLEEDIDIYNFEARFGSSEEWDFRIGYKQRDDKQVSAGIWIYL